MCITVLVYSSFWEPIFIELSKEQSWFTPMIFVNKSLFQTDGDYNVAGEAAQHD